MKRTQVMLELKTSVIVFMKCIKNLFELNTD